MPDPLAGWPGTVPVTAPTPPADQDKPAKEGQVPQPVHEDDGDAAPIGDVKAAGPEMEGQA